MKNIAKQDGEILIPSGGSLLFSNVTIPHTLEFIKELLEKKSLPIKEENVYISLRTLCMKQFCFQINNQSYQ